MRARRHKWLRKPEPHRPVERSTTLLRRSFARNRNRCCSRNHGGNRTNRANRRTSRGCGRCARQGMSSRTSRSLRSNRDDGHNRSCCRSCCRNRCRSHRRALLRRLPRRPVPRAREMRRTHKPGPRRRRRTRLLTTFGLATAVAAAVIQAQHAVQELEAEALGRQACADYQHAE